MHGLLEPAPAQSLLIKIENVKCYLMRLERRCVLNYTSSGRSVPGILHLREKYQIRNVCQFDGEVITTCPSGLFKVIYIVHSCCESRKHFIL